MAISRSKQKNKNLNQDDKYLFEYSKSKIVLKESWQDALQQEFIHCDESVSQSTTPICILHSLKLPSLNSIEEQLTFLNHVPNDHYYDYPSMTGRTRITRKKTLRQHLLFSPKVYEAAKHDDAPSSFRQRILYFLFVSHQLRPKYAKIVISSALNINLPTKLKTNKKTGLKRQKRQKRTESPYPFCEGAQNVFSFQDQYTNFTETVFRDYVKLIVRCFSSKGGYLIMNSYNRHNGRIELDSFINIRFTKLQSGLRIKCTCYDFRKTGGDTIEDLDPTGKKITARKRCMHVRFLYEFLETTINNIPNIEITPRCSRLQRQMDHTCKQHANKKTILVSENDSSVTFSVTDHHKTLPVFVLVNKSTHEARCQGSCRYKTLRTSNKTKHRYYLLSATTDENICPHIKTLSQNQKLLHDCLKKPSHADKEKKARRKEYFSVLQNKWVSISLGRHKPKSADDPDLKR